MTPSPLLTDAEAYALLLRNSFEAALPFMLETEYVFWFLLAFGLHPVLPVLAIATAAGIAAMWLLWAMGRGVSRLITPHLSARTRAGYERIGHWLGGRGLWVLLISGYGIFQILPFFAGIFGLPAKRSLPALAAASVIIHLLVWWVVAKG